MSVLLLRSGDPEIRRSGLTEGLIVEVDLKQRCWELSPNPPDGGQSL